MRGEVHGAARVDDDVAAAARLGRARVVDGRIPGFTSTPEFVGSGGRRLPWKSLNARICTATTPFASGPASGVEVTPPSAPADDRVLLVPHAGTASAAPAITRPAERATRDRDGVMARRGRGWD
jgi:hypothetical protein